MRRVLAFSLALLIAGWFLAGAATAVLAVVGPFHSGSAGYALQAQVEEAGFQLVSSPEGKAGYALRLLARRARDVEALSGSPRAAVALPYLNQALDRALLALADVPSDRSGPLWARLARAAGQARQAVAAAQAARQMYPQTVRGMLGKLDTLLAVAQSSPTAEALVRVVGITVPFPAALAAGVPQAVLLAWQNAPLQGGQSGKFHAMHAFFPLVGKHAVLACEQCHLNGQYVGTASACEACHAQDKPTPHFNADCALCHTPVSWKEVHFDHRVAEAANCANCHKKDEPANHFVGQCSLCHSTTAWRPAHFDHRAAAAANCAACHTKDRPANHFSGQCSLCHSTTAWRPARFNHQAVGATNCTACHTKNRPANHFSGQCSLCHSTTAWRPAHFNHQAVGATNCTACHTKSRPANHFSGQCSLCHSTTAWKPAHFNHSFDIYHGGANGTCSVCHPNGYTSYSCLACHDNNQGGGGDD